MEDSIVITLSADTQQDLTLCNFGYSQTLPGHRYGPSVRPYFLIHYILSGKGTFQVNGITYELHGGQGFFIAPDYQTVYTADAKEPWAYVWVAFSGRQAEQITSALGLIQDKPVFSSDEAETLKHCVMEMLRHNRSNPVDQYYTFSMLYLFLSTIAASQKEQELLPPPTGNDYVFQARTYIQNHMHESMTTEDVADYVGLNRSYFSTLFKKHMGVSPLQYIQTSRITKALHMLESSDLSVAAIAYSCGYQKAEAFMKIFKQTMGMSPTEYRRQKRDGAESFNSN